MYKATLVLFFFFIIPPLFTSQAPQFINHSLLTRNWELLHLLFVGIAVSYGLFSRRNHDTDKDNNNNNNSKFDTAQSLVSRFLQVSSFFEDDVESESPVESDETKVQTWNNQHHRNQPMLVVAPRLDHSDFDHHSPEKPLLLPIRSLKSRVSDEDDDNVVDVQSLSRSTTSKRFSSSLNRKSKVEDKKKENVVVLPSPIPWRSRSGRMEPKQEVDDASNMMLPSKEESRPVKSQTSSHASSKTSSLTSSPNLAPFSSESLAKNAEDHLVRKKGFHKCCPPPPPPPPPMMFHKSISTRPRKIIQNEDHEKGPALNGVKSSKKDEASCGTLSDEGPDVDKKADEFIAKFREQIRLQRIESIKRSTRSARNSSR
uniref:DUF4408 domain-containing protein n=1 Tax=Cajanus cajan TaxID=3821 RepID=A0A151SKS4_CAJCA|nr:hypothetical protein KK1_001648 [Cajanus cajan]